MPHVRSPAAQQLRYERAWLRNYIQRKPPELRWLAVPSPLFLAAKAMVASLAAHLEDECRTERSFHYARQANWHAYKEGWRMQEPFERTGRLHRQANRAKHTPQRYQTLPAREPGLEVACEDSPQIHDPLYKLDPWANAVHASKEPNVRIQNPWNNYVPTTTGTFDDNVDLAGVSGSALDAASEETGTVEKLKAVSSLSALEVDAEKVPTPQACEATNFVLRPSVGTWLLRVPVGIPTINLCGMWESAGYVDGKTWTITSFKARRSRYRFRIDIAEDSEGYYLVVLQNNGLHFACGDVWQRVGPAQLT